tara:strand:- start:72 stop:269 length:198 start_codon:yes stop_codon:yes gene_type:complete
MNERIKNTKDVLRNKSGSAWLTEIIITNPRIIYADCFRTINVSALEAEYKKNNPNIEMVKRLKNK